MDKESRDPLDRMEARANTFLDRRRKSDPNPKSQSKWNDTAVLLFCFFGLQGMYLTWGVLQEKIMTQEYPSGRFTSSAFLVCANRIAAVVMGFVLVSWSRNRGEAQGNAPLYEYFYPAFSNFLSSLSAYEALKHVSFPLQVLTKASKLIPVMIMGTILQKKRYEWTEYAQAVVLTLGVAMFFWSEHTSHNGNHNNEEDSTAATGSTAFGFLLLTVYICADSFTSQYQDKVYKTFHATQYEMMLWMNAFQIVVSLVTLIFRAELFSAIAFLLGDPTAFADVTMLSLTTSFGQLFIYYTLKRFGPITFSLIMLVRQVLSLVISCLVYRHPIGALGYLGVSIVFGVVFYRWYGGRSKK